MKTLPALFAAHILKPATTLAVALRITRTDNEVYAFTSHDIDDTIDAVLYKASPGLDVTNIEIAANASVGNLELTTLHDQETFTAIDLIGGKWRNAAFTIFRYNYNALAGGIDTLLAGNLGEFTINRNTLIVELRDIRQYLQQGVGDVTSKTCRARLGDARCLFDIESTRVSGTITSVTSNRVFADSGRTEADDWFGEGEITWVTGANEGLRTKVKTFANTGGEFSLALPMFATVEVGDTYTAVPGCRKRLEEDCRDKFNNVLNFVGEPHRAGLNNLTSAPGVVA